MLFLQRSAAALLLQQIADPTPLFCTIPAEAWDLIGSNKARVNIRNLFVDDSVQYQEEGWGATPRHAD